MTQAQVEASLHQFEGLVRETARQICQEGVELEEEDIRQLIRIKVWHAVQKFSQARADASKHLSHSRDRHGWTPLQRYVFMCVTNLRKDVVKRVRHYDRSIDELRADEEHHENVESAHRRDVFDARYLSVEAEEVYAEVEEPTFALPTTLSKIERAIVELRLGGMVFLQIDQTLGLSRVERQAHMDAVRVKLSDWAPAPTRTAPLAPLPGLRSGRRATPHLAHPETPARK